MKSVFKVEIAYGVFEGNTQVWHSETVEVNAVTFDQARKLAVTQFLESRENEGSNEEIVFTTPINVSIVEEAEIEQRIADICSQMAWNDNTMMKLQQRFMKEKRLDAPFYLMLKSLAENKSRHKIE